MIVIPITTAILISIRLQPIVTVVGVATTRPTNTAQIIFARPLTMAIRKVLGQGRQTARIAGVPTTETPTLIRTRTTVITAITWTGTITTTIFGRDFVAATKMATTVDIDTAGITTETIAF